MDEARLIATVIGEHATAAGVILALSVLVYRLGGWLPHIPAIIDAIKRKPGDIQTSPRIPFAPKAKRVNRVITSVAADAPLVAMDHTAQPKSLPPARVKTRKASRT